MKDQARDEGGGMKDETKPATAPSQLYSPKQAAAAQTKAMSSSSFIPHPSSFVTPPSSLRILLWDIDGTLIRSVRAGAFKDYTVPMLEEVFGTAGRLPQMKVSGMTDLQIVGEALKHEGFTHEDIRERIGHLRQSYMEAMRKATGNGDQFFEVLPGVRELLKAVNDHPRYLSALVTGNIEPAAYFKMELVALAEFFPLPGAFGDESHDRRDLPALAADRIRKHLQLHLRPEQFIVIGDTPNDIECAQHFGARSLAVGTGRFYTDEALLACNPDAFASDLSDPNQIMETLAGL
jgi:phosphoglycolate phosphatase